MNYATKQKAERKAKLMPNGIPKYIRVYCEKEEFWNEYTCIFTGKYPNKNTVGECNYVFYNGCDTGAGWNSSMIDVNKWGFAPAFGRKNHLGTRIKFEDLPKEFKSYVRREYKEWWGLVKVKY